MNILAGARRVVPPFVSLFTMRRDGDGAIRCTASKARSGISTDARQGRTDKDGGFSDE
ncbi:MAG: hypothetical protein R3D85_00590 [Paracoccaceae bacterium]